MEHVTGPYELTELEANALRLGTEEWDDDNWYGMWGFLQDYKNLITPRLLEILEGLPKYKDDTLF
jgi:hypothetical protein